MQVEIPGWGIITFICLIVFMIGCYLYKKGKLGDVMLIIFIIGIVLPLPISLFAIVSDIISMDNHKFLTVEEKRYVDWKDKALFRTVPYSEIKRRIKKAEEDKQNEEKAYRDS